MRLQLAILLAHHSRIQAAGLAEVWGGFADQAFMPEGRTLQWPLGWSHALPPALGPVHALYVKGSGYLAVLRVRRSPSWLAGSQAVIDDMLEVLTAGAPVPPGQC